MADRRTTVARTIAAPVETVWSLLVDGARYPDWNPTVLRLDGSLAEGSRFELVSTLDPGRTFKLRVAEMEPPHRMVWEDGMPLGLFRGVRTFQLVPEARATEFTMSEVFSGPLSGLITKAIPDLTESFEQFAEALRATAEGRKAPDRLD